MKYKFNHNFASKVDAIHRILEFFSLSQVKDAQLSNGEIELLAFLLSKNLPLDNHLKKEFRKERSAAYVNGIIKKLENKKYLSKVSRGIYEPLDWLKKLANNLDNEGVIFQIEYDVTPRDNKSDSGNFGDKSEVSEVSD